MPIKENQMRDVLKEMKKARKTGQSYAPDEHEVVSELLHSQKDHFSVVTTLPIEDRLHVLLDTNLMNDYGIFGAKRAEWRHERNKRKFVRGRVLKIDFGIHNIGHEMSYPHMGVVMANFEYFIVVVPVTTNRNQDFGQKSNMATLNVDQRLGAFHGNSRLLVFQMRAVHKNRILSDEGFSLKERAPEVFDQLENLVAKTFARGVVEKQEQELAELRRLHREQVTQLQSDYEELQKEIFELANRIRLESDSIDEVAATNEFDETSNALRAFQQFLQKFLQTQSAEEKSEQDQD